MNVLQRVTWNGRPVNQGECFRLTKNRRTAVCTLWTHQMGWELRLEAAGELLQTQVCRAEEDVFTTFESWKAAMLEKGWA